jgi:hypothetical protein
MTRPLRQGLTHQAMDLPLVKTPDDRIDRPANYEKYG